MKNKEERHRTEEETIRMLYNQMDEISKELDQKDKELALLMKQKIEARKKAELLEAKLQKLKEAPLAKVTLRDNGQSWKQRVKLLETDKKKLKVRINELEHNLEIEKQEVIECK